MGPFGSTGAWRPFSASYRPRFGLPAIPLDFLADATDIPTVIEAPMREAIRREASLRAALVGLGIGVLNLLLLEMVFPTPRR